jgi:hypothetical protein
LLIISQDKLKKEKETMTQTVEAINKYLEEWGADGHTIIKAEALVGYGFTQDFVDKFSYSHKSDGTAKGSLTDNSGKPVDSIKGVYSLEFLYGIAKDIEADTAIAHTKMGRGFQAGELCIAINNVLKSS